MLPLLGLVFSSSMVLAQFPEIPIPTQDSQAATLGKTAEMLNAALKLSDKAIEKIAQSLIASYDKNSKVLGAESKYSKRLLRLASKFDKEVENLGLRTNYRVYQRSEINAFAMADGSIRFYTGIMDSLTDQELQWVIAHEIGHVALKHVHRRARLSILKNGLLSAVLEQSQNQLDGDAANLGKFFDSFLGSAYSRSQESESDRFSLRLALKLSLDPRAGISTLRKFAEKRKSNQVDLLASHPAPKERIGEIEKQLKLSDGDYKRVVVELKNNTTSSRSQSKSEADSEFVVPLPEGAGYSEGFY